MGPKFVGALRDGGGAGGRRWHVGPSRQRELSQLAGRFGLHPPLKTHLLSIAILIISLQIAALAESV